jgi:internalin A
MKPNIPDVALYRLFDRIINRSSLIRRDVDEKTLSKIRYLNANQREIRNLFGIELCRNLETLHLCGNRFTDISPLAMLPRLRYLDLSDNPQIDWTNLFVTFDSVEELELRNCGLETDEILLHFPNVRRVSLYHNRIPSIRILYQLKGLESVNLAQNPLSDEEMETFYNQTGCGPA